MDFTLRHSIIDVARFAGAHSRDSNNSGCNAVLAQTTDQWRRAREIRVRATSQQLPERGREIFTRRESNIDSLKLINGTAAHLAPAEVGLSMRW